MLKNPALPEKECSEKVLIRIPQMPGSNTQESCIAAEADMRRRGFRTERFTYVPKMWEAA